MLSEYAAVAIAAFIIGTMLLLFINITTANRAKLRAATATQADRPETAPALARDPASAADQVLVYPVYVDCSLSLLAYDTPRL